MIADRQQRASISATGIDTRELLDYTNGKRDSWIPQTGGLPVRL